MKTIRSLVLVVALIAMTFSLSAPVQAAPGGQFIFSAGTSGTETVGNTHPLPSTECPTNGYLTVASRTITVGSTTRVICPVLPAGTHILTVFCQGSGLGVNYGTVNVASGTAEPFIAVNTQNSWNVATTTPAIYFVSRDASDTALLILAR